MPSTSRQKLIEEAVLTRIQGLSLTGMPGGNVVTMIDAKLRDAVTGAKGELPRIVVTHSEGTETIDPNAGTNASDDIGYPVRVYILAAANQDEQSNSDRWLGWRQSIVGAFHNKRLTVTGLDCFRCVVQPMTIHSQAAWAANLWLSGLTVTVSCRVVRT